MSDTEPKPSDLPTPESSAPVPSGSTEPSSQPAADATGAAGRRVPSVRFVGIGSAGLSVIQQLASNGVPPEQLAAVSPDADALGASAAVHRVHLESKPLRGLGTGGDPDRGRNMAEDEYASLKALCCAEVVFILAGLGGGAGTGISPVLARAAKEAGALVLGFVSLPFGCEGNRRQRLAQHGLEELRLAADGVISLDNEKVLKLIDENTSVLDAFRLTDQFLADAVRGVWRLLAHPGLIEIHFSDFCEMVRDKHSDSVFAVAEAMGPTRSREVLDRLLAHPMLERGAALKEAETVMVSLLGGPDLTMAEVNRVVQEIGGYCRHAQLLMGASIEDSFRDKLSVMIVASQAVRSEPTPRGATPEGLESQLLDRGRCPSGTSRFVAPAPSLSPEQLQQMANRGPVGGKSRKSLPRLRQTQLVLDIVSKGRFEKSEPTIHKGEDLDVPTFVRRGILLN